MTRHAPGHRAVAMLMLLLLAVPISAAAQAQAPGPVQWRILSEPSASAEMDPSLRRHLIVGSGIGAAAGTALGFFVIAMADCGGSGCTGERVIGVLGNAAGGAVIGALGGWLIYLIRR